MMSGLTAVGDAILSGLTTLLASSPGQIVAGLISLGLLGVIAYKFRHLFGVSK
jgi:hypothetical protein